MRTLKTSIVLAIIATCAGLAPVVSAQKVNSLYFLDRSPINSRINPAMTPKASGFGVGLSNMSINLQSDLAFDDLLSNSSGSTLFLLNEGFDKASFISNLKDVSSFRYGMNMEIFTLGIRMKNIYFSFHSGLNVDMGIGVPKDMFKMVVMGMDKDVNDNVINTTFDMTDMNMETLVYNKTGAGLSLKIGDMVSVGANVDYLAGLAHTKIGFDELTINASQTQWDVTSKGYFQMTSPDFATLKYGEDGYLSGVKTQKMENVAADFNSIEQQLAGTGYSIDLGVTVKPLPFLSLSAALTDLGSINWKKEKIQKASSNGTFTYEGMDLSANNDEGDGDGEEGGDDNSKLMDELEQMVRFEQETVTEGYSTALTKKVTLGAEAGLLNNKITFGVMSQTGFTPTGKYNDLMLSANLKPSSLLQGALTYSLLHGEMSSFGAAINMKLLFVNAFIAADYIPLKYAKGGQFDLGSTESSTNALNIAAVPLNNSYYNFQFGLNFMF